MIDLHDAAKKGDLATCRVLIEQDVDVNAKDVVGDTPLHKAAFIGHLDICELLIQHGAHVNTKENHEWTPLHPRFLIYKAARGGHLKICKLLIKHDADINAQNYEGKTPLFIAAECGHLEICELLVEHGADVNAYAYARLPLFEAAKNGYLKICQLLIRYGADVNSKNGVEWTPLHYAAYEGHHEICELLIEQGADVNEKNLWEETPLLMATKKGHHETCEVLLIKHHAVIDIDVLSKYRKFKQSMLKYCFQYFKLKTDQELHDILTQKNATIRPFFLQLIQNEIPKLDPSVEKYTFDLLYVNKRYKLIRLYIERGLGFKNVRYSTNKGYTKRYRLWKKRWQFEYRCNQLDNVPKPTFSNRNIRFELLKTNLQIVFFDDCCDFCIQQVMRIYKMDHQQTMYFCPLSSNKVNQLLHNMLIPSDSLIYFRPFKLYNRSDAVIAIMKDLNIVGASLLKCVPKSIRNMIYSIVARNRCLRNTPFQPESEFKKRWLL